MLSDEKIDEIQGAHMRTWPISPRRFARLIEAEVRKQDAELIRQMRDALAYSTDPDHPHYGDQIAALAAANARLEGT